MSLYDDPQYARCAHPGCTNEGEYEGYCVEHLDDLPDDYAGPVDLDLVDEQPF